MRNFWIATCVTLGLTWSPALAEDLQVSTRPEIVAALSSAQPGDRILIAPGTYAGGFYQENLTGVTIRSADPDNPAVIQGGTNGIQLSDAIGVVIEHLVFDGATGNGINVDDGGSFSTPTTNLTIRDVVVRNVGPGGNHDGIKLSGVTGFLIDRVQILDWGDGGSAIDPVGSHHGLIQNSFMRHASGGSSAVRPKGGSKYITVRANRIEMPAGQGRALAAGGSTGASFFRFIDGDANYEADEIVFEGNVIFGASSPFAWVNIDGGVFHHNYAHRPWDWAVRILNENQETPIVDTQNGVFADNVIVFNDSASEWRTAVNVGPEVHGDSFLFARNHWYNLADPSAAGSKPQLPADETDGVYGVDPSIDPDGAIMWPFPWGVWVVNATANAVSLDVGTLPPIKAVAGDEAQFAPLEEVPFVGDWTFSEIGGQELEIGPFSQMMFTDFGSCPMCIPLPGDYNNDGQVGTDDYDAWAAAFGTVGESLADGNDDGTVNAGDYVIWRNRLAEAQSPPTTTYPLPEPGTGFLGLALMLVAAVRQGRRAMPGAERGADIREL